MLHICITNIFVFNSWKVEGVDVFPVLCAVLRTIGPWNDYCCCTGSTGWPVSSLPSAGGSRDPASSIPTASGKIDLLIVKPSRKGSVKIRTCFLEKGIWIQNKKLCPTLEDFCTIIGFYVLFISLIKRYCKKKLPSPLFILYLLLKSLMILMGFWIRMFWSDPTQ